jgi:hypothetical protein
LVIKLWEIIVKRIILHVYVSPYSYTGQPVAAVKRPFPNISNTVGNVYAGQLVVLKSMTPNISNAVGDVYAGQFVVLKRCSPNEDNTFGNDYAGKLFRLKRRIIY